MELTVVGIFGAVASAITAPLIQRYLPAHLNDLFRVKPVLVHVETDPAIMYAGGPTGILPRSYSEMLTWTSNASLRLLTYAVSGELGCGSVVSSTRIALKSG